MNLSMFLVFEEKLGGGRIEEEKFWYFPARDRRIPASFGFDSGTKFLSLCAMEHWNYGWEDPRGCEQQNVYGGGYQECNYYAESPMPCYNQPCALCNSPRHSPFECSLRFEYPDFMQEYEYMRMYQETFVPEAYPLEQVFEPRKPSLEEQLAQLEASNVELQASQAQCLASQARLHATLEAFNAQLQGSHEMTSHSNEQFELSLHREPPFTIYEHDSFFGQVEPNSSEEVHCEHYEQELPIQDREGDVQRVLGYGSLNARGVRDYTLEEPVHSWTSNLHHGDEVLEENSEEVGSLCSEDDFSSEDDIELEDIFHEPLILEADIPIEEESPSMHCNEEEVDETRTISPPTSMETDHELPKVYCRTLSTFVLNEKIELEVILPLNPPLSDQCFYNEVMDWKGNGALVLNPSHHTQVPLPPIVPMRTISTSILEEKARMAPKSRIEKRKARKLHFWPPIGVFF